MDVAKLVKSVLYCSGFSDTAEILIYFGRILLVRTSVSCRDEIVAPHPVPEASVVMENSVFSSGTDFPGSAESKIDEKKVFQAILRNQI